MISEKSHLPGTTRRTFIGTSAALVGAAPFVSRAALAATPACVLTSEQEEGPYYVDYEKIRQNVTEGHPGLPMRLRVRLVHAAKCSPLVNAAVDIWHCDALGVYSAFTAMSPDGPNGRGPGRRRFGPPSGAPPFMGGPEDHHAMDDTRFLRGVQLTDRAGAVEFVTIYPGWYTGRAIHIHVKVHIAGEASERYAGGHVAHTGQFFFPEEISDRVAKLEPYAKRLKVHRTTQDEDHIFLQQQGATSMLTLSRLENRSDTAGFVADITIAVDPDAVPKPVGMRGGPRP